MSLNSHKALCSDPVLIEDTAFLYMFLAASLEKVRARMGRCFPFRPCMRSWLRWSRSCLRLRGSVGGLGVFD